MSLKQPEQVWVLDITYNIDYEVYVSNFNTNVTSFYILSDGTYLLDIKTSFLQSYLHRDYRTGHKIQEWINNLKRVS